MQSKSMARWMMTMAAAAILGTGLTMAYAQSGGMSGGDGSGGGMGGQGGQGGQQNGQAGDQMMDQSGEKMQMAMKLLEMTKAREAADQNMKQAIGQMRQQQGMPPAFFDEFEKAINIDQMMQAVAQVYANRLSVEEMQAAIDFYSTPVGQSFAAKQPAILAEVTVIGEQMGQQWAQTALQNMQNQGGGGMQDGGMQDGGMGGSGGSGGSGGGGGGGMGGGGE